uniref:UDP-N-acetylglucosamine transporter n=1 Tax=Ciona savignyi TaxID=51511 RepID=H2ZM52_CIOSA
MSAIKYVVLVLLVLQTTCMVLIVRYTRTVKSEGPRYLPSTVVLLAEFVKFLSCLFVIFYQCGFHLRKFISEVKHGIFGNPLETIKISVPSGIYAFQNNLLFVALNYLDAPTYQVTYQLKILMTALFSTVVLRKRLSSTQWISLVLLMVGVALVQYPSEGTSVESAQSWSNRMFGVGSLLIACASSGFAGVYFEMLLKNSNISLWIRNIQMAIFGILFSGLTVAFTNWDIISKDGFFQGYSTPVLVVLLLQAYGGILVACVVQYTDNIIKGFATSLSIIVSTVVSYLIFNDMQPTRAFTIGTILVIGATFVYGLGSRGNTTNKSNGKER